MDPNSELYAFGSVVRGRYTASSDIDILVVSMRKELEYEINMNVYSELDAPVELHFAAPNQFSGWYLRFIEEGGSPSFGTERESLAHPLESNPLLVWMILKTQLIVISSRDYARQLTTQHYGERRPKDPVSNSSNFAGRSSKHSRC